MYSKETIERREAPSKSLVLRIARPLISFIKRAARLILYLGIAIMCLMAAQIGMSVLEPLGWDGYLAYEFTGALCALVCAGILFKKRCFSISPTILKIGWQMYSYFFIVALLLACYEYLSCVALGYPIAENWQLLVLQQALLCVGVGIFEECVFRGIIFMGCMHVLAPAKHKLLYSVLICSLLFGCAHISPEVIDLQNTIILGQIIGKILQTGLISVVFCWMVARTHSLVAPIIAHATEDFLLLVFASGVFGIENDFEYVDTTNNGYAQLVFYGILILITLPCVWHAWCVFKKSKMPASP